VGRNLWRRALVTAGRAFFGQHRLSKISHFVAVKRFEQNNYYLQVAKAPEPVTDTEDDLR
jgi:hypothetical protein